MATSRRSQMRKLTTAEERQQKEFAFLWARRLERSGGGAMETRARLLETLSSRGNSSGNKTPGPGGPGAGRVGVAADEIWIALTIGSEVVVDV